MMPGFAYDPRLKAMLAEAAKKYRLRDDDAFRRLMEQAVELAPQRLDLWFGLANHHIQTGSPDLALGIYRELANTVPYDADTLFHLSHWLRHAGEALEAEDYLRGLEAVRPDAAADLVRIWREIDASTDTPITDALPRADEMGQRIAIVTLGYVLNQDGTMHGILEDRLHKTLEAAETYPDSVIIVSGGVPRNTEIEAVVMRRWLEEKGVDGRRIFEEGYARDVVENLIYSRHILDIIGADTALLVTSACDVRRAGSGMRIQIWRNGSRWKADVVAAGGESLASFRDDGSDRLKLYRDALRAYGTPMMRTFPELAER